MKAIQIQTIGSPDVLAYVDVDTPVPGPGQILIRSQFIGVQLTDVQLQRGTYPAMPPLPKIPGKEVSGIVESVGDNVTAFSPGDPVVAFVDNGYAEYTIAHVNATFKIPSSVALDAAVALPIGYQTAYHILHTASHAQSGQSIFIRASAGGVGTALTQLAKLANMQVIGLTSSQEKVQFTLQQGADIVINYKTEDVVKRVKEVTHGKGVDLILDGVGGEVFGQNFELLAPFGQIVLYGIAAGLPQGNLVALMLSSLYKSIGLNVFSLGTVIQTHTEWISQSMHTLLDYLSEGKIGPQISAKLPLAEAAQAHERLEFGNVLGKILLVP